MGHVAVAAPQRPPRHLSVQHKPKEAGCSGQGGGRAVPGREVGRQVSGSYREEEWVGGNASCEALD